MGKSCKKITELGLKKIAYYKGLNKDEFDKIGKKFAKNIKGSEIVLFFGDLGSGKTTFIRAFLKEFQIPEHEVRSPTFNIVNAYSSEKFDFYHIDAYRITSDELFEIGFYDYQNEGSVILVEWAEKIIDDIDDADYLIKISIDDADLSKRDLTIFKK
jgi:tRNA threonylcarbamoyladenosine biosynthesis protein TsaE